MIKGLFFDLDGTLVDTYEADFSAYRDAILEVLQITIGREDFMRTNGMEAKQKLELLAPGTSDDQLALIRESKKRYYKQYLSLTRPNHTLIAFLKDMAEHHTLAIVTTAKRHNAEAVLEAHGLLDAFDVQVYGDDVTNAKPHPESYQQALEKSGLSAPEVIAFEDSRSGIDAAHAAGIATIQIRSFQ